LRGALFPYYLYLSDFWGFVPNKLKLSRGSNGDLGGLGFLVKEPLSSFYSKPHITRNFYASGVEGRTSYPKTLKISIKASKKRGGIVLETGKMLKSLKKSLCALQ